MIEIKVDDLDFDFDKEVDFIVRKATAAAVLESQNITPVDTGKLRASWEFSVKKEQMEYAALVFNDLHYAEKIEDGGSKQAPNGMLSHMNFAASLELEAGW